MKRVLCLLVVTAIGSAAVAATAPSQTSPPGPGSEWTQQDWNTLPPMTGPQGGVFGPQRGGPPVEMQQRMQDMQRRMQQMEAQAQAARENNIRQALAADDAQWAQIKPRLDRIERLKTEVNASVDPGGGFNSSSGFTSSTTPGGRSSGGGSFGGSFGVSSQSGPNGTRTQNWSSGVPAGRSSTGEPTTAERICQDLHNLLQNPSVPAAQVSQKVAAFRQARQQAERQLAQERKDLRALLNFRQEAALIVMGYLD
jgi:hypothetical protein